MGFDCNNCPKSYDVRSSRQSHYRQYPSHKPDHWHKCPDCGERQGNIGNHLNYSDCGRPKITPTQMEMLTGLIMGDGAIKTTTTNPKIQCEMTTKEYLEYVSSRMGGLGLGVTPSSGNLWYWSTTTHPKFNEFDSWYRGEGRDKVFPESIDLTPTTLKHWYCCDGGIYNYHQTNNQIEITTKNEIKNKDKIERYFEEVGFEPRGWTGPKIVFSVAESEKIYEYMGDPLPGFEYKWPEEYR